MNYAMRLTKLRKKMEQEKIDAFFLMSAPNYFYLTGFTGSSAAIIVTQQEFILFTDSRYIAQSKAETTASDVTIVIHKLPLLEEVKTYFMQLDCQNIGYESDHLLVSQLFMLEDKEHYQLQACNAFIEELRYIKDTAEITVMKEAAQIGEEVLKDALAYVKVGMREVDLAIRMESTMRKLGASGPSFDTIIASGIRGALPHGAASEKVIESGDLVTIDFGVVYKGYCSDMTRTFAVGTPQNEELVKIYNIVLAANLAGIKAIQPNKTGLEIDLVARSVIDNEGYGEYFGHSLGHAVGIEVHELPALSPRGHMTIKSGMVVTVEPGIYIENLGGVRIEDTLVVTDTGSDNFMTLPKELIIV